MVRINQSLKSRYRSYEDVKNFIRLIGLNNNKEWRTWSKSTEKPNDIPAAPDKIYAKQGWVSWGDFLGTGTEAKKNFKSFEEAKVFARQLKFNSRNDWNDWSKGKQRPNDIPSNPSKVYKNQGWSGWGDFLGTGSIANFNKKFRSFKEAKVFVRSLKLNGKNDWFKWTKTCERPIDIPTAPNRTYAKKGWQNWRDWLETNEY